MASFSCVRTLKLSFFTGHFKFHDNLSSSGFSLIYKEFEAEKRRKADEQKMHFSPNIAIFTHFFALIWPFSRKVQMFPKPVRLFVDWFMIGWCPKVHSGGKSEKKQKTRVDFSQPEIFKKYDTLQNFHSVATKNISRDWPELVAIADSNCKRQRK